MNIKQLVTTVYKYLRGHNERLQRGAALAEVARDGCEGCGQTHTGEGSAT